MRIRPGRVEQMVLMGQEVLLDLKEIKVIKEELDLQAHQVELKETKDSKVQPDL